MGNGWMCLRCAIPLLLTLVTSLRYATYTYTHFLFDYVVVIVNVIEQHFTGNKQWEIQECGASCDCSKWWDQNVGGLILQPWQWCSYLPCTTIVGERGNVPNICVWGLHEALLYGQVPTKGAKISSHQGSQLFLEYFKSVTCKSLYQHDTLQEELNRKLDKRPQCAARNIYFLIIQMLIYNTWFVYFLYNI